MTRPYNFSAGPGMLPEAVLTEIQQELLNWHGTGMSIMEVGHRGEEFALVAKQAEADLRELMQIPSNYRVLFLAGGATVHFAMVPLNLLGKNRKADYFNTGIWSAKAIAEAKRFGEINVAVESIQAENKLSVPQSDLWKLSQDADYVHYTPNETIDGIEFQSIPEVGDVPLVADMSSMILSRKLDVSRFGLIYAGAQKNIGQAGISIAIIREDLLKEPLTTVPSLYSYALQAEHQSFYNTPPTFAWYVAGRVFAWMKKMGGLAYFDDLNQIKSAKLYRYLDAHADFYTNPVDPAYRSRMNVTFNLPNDDLTKMFLSEADQAGLKNLRGHRLAGGVRASIYNAMPEAGVDALLNFMQDFMNKHS